MFQLTRLLRGVTVGKNENCPICGVSTHTPLARRDPMKYGNGLSMVSFNSHASCEA